MTMTVEKYKGSVIYNIRNIINDNIYIGSAVHFNKRIYQHKFDFKNNIHHSIYLQRAYNKYGKDNFIFEIIEYVDDTSNLIKREQLWINFFKPVYNMAKIAGSRKGIKQNMSVEAINKMIENKIISVNQYDINNNFIANYKSMAEATRITGVSNIERVCKGQRKTAGGYIWKYKNKQNKKK